MLSRDSLARFVANPACSEQAYGLAPTWECPRQVSAELRQFEARRQAALTHLDLAIPAGKKLNADQCGAVIDLCAWAHSEWVRIHPFANGNGRTARLWANFLAVRYGLPPFIRLRPRPGDGYEEAGAQAMLGNWEPTATVLRGYAEYRPVVSNATPEGRAMNRRVDIVIPRKHAEQSAK